MKVRSKQESILSIEQSLHCYKFTVFTYWFSALSFNEDITSTVHEAYNIEIECEVLSSKKIIKVLSLTDTISVQIEEDGTKAMVIIYQFKCVLVE